jgi:hypothetical protein
MLSGMNDRGERRFLWFLVILVGAGFCVFSLSNSAAPARLAFLPVGLLIIALATYRLRRLSRRRPRKRDSE